MSVFEQGLCRVSADNFFVWACACLCIDLSVSKLSISVCMCVSVVWESPQPV